MKMIDLFLALFARALSSVDIRSVISNIGSATGSAPAAAAAGGGAAPAEEKSKFEPCLEGFLNNYYKLWNVIFVLSSTART